MKFLRKIDLEINKDIYDPIKVKQNDTARYLLFNLLDNRVPFSLENKTVRVYGVKPDGTKVFNNLTIVDANRGLAELQLTTQMLIRPGCLKLELVIYEATDILSTTKFDIDIISCIRDDGAIESTNEFSALTVALAKADEYGEALKQGTENIELIYATELNGVKSSLEEKVNKEQGKGLSTNDYTIDEKNKLSNIEERANAYVHPLNHSATIITQDSTHRFITDIERDRWNNTFNHASSNCEVLTTKEGTKIGVQHGYIRTDGSEYWMTVTFPNAFKNEFYSAFVSPFYKSGFGSVAKGDLTPLNMKVCAESGVLYVYWLAIGELAE